MTLKEMEERKRELGFTNEMIAKLSGVPLGTVQKIFAGITKAPRRDTLIALEKILEKKPGGYTYDFEARRGKWPDTLAEEVAPYGEFGSRQGTYTIDDYYALPDERRVELIDGYFYDMAAPSQIHQALLGQLYLQFAACMESHPECELFFAPLDVRLDNDKWTMVQPDLLIVCDRKDMDVRRINGAPDFVIEILSPSNRAHDMFRKLDKYRFAQVREYWIVDPEKLRVVVYDLAHDAPPQVYTMHDTVPVLISGGECRIDFGKIYDRVKRYLDNNEDGE